MSKSSSAREANLAQADRAYKKLMSSGHAIQQYSAAFNETLVLSSMRHILMSFSLLFGPENLAPFLIHARVLQEHASSNNGAVLNISDMEELQEMGRAEVGLVGC